MSAWAIGTISLLYLVAGASLVVEGKPGLALFCFGCVIANAGLIVAARG